MRFSKLLLWVSLLLNVLLIALCVYVGQSESDSFKKVGAIKPQPDSIRYYDARSLRIIGKINPENNYRRIPEKFEKVLDDKVWNLSKESTGIAVEFVSDSPFITLSWDIPYYKELRNITCIATNGFDLYTQIGEQWQYAGSASAWMAHSDRIIASNLSPGLKKYRLHLPLFAEVTNLKIGVSKSATMQAAPPTQGKPIVFYGTSITQGASASRPGLAYTSILSRQLSRECINLGFTGQGKFDSGILEVLCTADPEIFVLDCVPNSKPEVVRKEALKFIKAIKKCKPDVPVLLMESLIRESAYLKRQDKRAFGSLEYIRAQNRELRMAYEAALAEGLHDLYYLKGDELLGDDHEATVDGTHPNDLGQMRIAAKVGEKLLEILGRSTASRELQ